MTKIIGLTGGIGSGKTTAARYFAELGVSVYIADDAARKVMDSEDIKQQLRVQFGDNIFEGGILDRKALAKIVFDEPLQLKALNSLVHPAVAKHFELWLMQHREEDFVIREAAILFESGSYKDCDKIITVIAPYEDRIERVMQRDKVTRAEVIKRMENQWSDAEKIAKSDFVITNNTLPDLRLHVAEIFQTLKKI